MINIIDPILDRFSKLGAETDDGCKSINILSRRDLNGNNASYRLDVVGTSSLSGAIEL